MSTEIHEHDVFDELLECEGCAELLEAMEADPIPGDPGSLDSDSLTPELDKLLAGFRYAVIHTVEMRHIYGDRNSSMEQAAKLEEWAAEGALRDYIEATYRGAQNAR